MTDERAALHDEALILALSPDHATHLLIVEAKIKKGHRQSKQQHMSGYCSAFVQRAELE